nr:energy-coupling factor transporter transmembrane component T [Arachnia propionica]
METGRGERSLLRLDPRTKFVLMGILAFVELVEGSNLFTAAVAVIPIALLMQNRQFKIATWYGVLFACAMLARIFQESIHLPLVLNMILVLRAGFVLRLAPAFAMAAYFVSTTSASECVASLSRIGVSRKITIPISVAFRFFPTMREEFHSINDAMRMRGIRLGSRKFWGSPLMLLEYRFIPLVISLAKIGNELSAAALTRGLERPGEHTSIARVGIRPVDVIVVLLVVALLVATYVIH